ncbi:MAG: hypothetical protein M3Y85_02550 [Bacteroidota bacterium]|nr:hypothetical protein [Bacteroidota bacterium]
MKKFLILSIAVIGFASVQAQKKMKSVNAPVAAKEAFAKAHPNVTGTWEKEEGNYEVTFKEGGKSMSCVITAAGKVLETETDMAVSELPAAVTSYIAQHYKGAKVKGAATIIKADGTTEYEANIKGKDVMFDANGKVMKAEKEKD